MLSSRLGFVDVNIEEYTIVRRVLKRELVLKNERENFLIGKVYSNYLLYPIPEAA